MSHRHSATEEKLLALPIEEARQLTERVIQELHATTPNWGDDDYFGRVEELLS